MPGSQRYAPDTYVPCATDLSAVFYWNETNPPNQRLTSYQTNLRGLWLMEPLNLAERGVDLFPWYSNVANELIISVVRYNGSRITFSELGYTNRNGMNAFFGRNPSPQYVLNRYLVGWIENALGTSTEEAERYIEEMDQEVLTDWLERFVSLGPMIWPPCPTCGDSACRWAREPEHPNCEMCGDQASMDGNSVQYELHIGNCAGEHLGSCYLCENCTTRYTGGGRATHNTRFICAGSANLIRRRSRQPSTSVTNRMDTEIEVCNHHARLDGSAFCRECGLYNAPAIEGDWYTVDRANSLCTACARRQGLVFTIQPWNYVPELVFHPTVPTNPKKPLYIGMELECSFRRYPTQQELTEWYSNAAFQDLIYVKSDSSVVNGFEIVTHPMEPRWALEHFPFDAFDYLVNRMGARTTHETAGTHIHLSKDGFTSAHLWKFLQVHIEQEQVLLRLGGRGNSSYASFQARGSHYIKEEMKQIAKQKGVQGLPVQRYYAINMLPEYTVELRYPASGIGSHKIRKNIELALALYEFSDFMSVEDFKNGAASDPGYFLGWIRDNNYPDLLEEVNMIMPTPKSLKGRVI